MATFNFAVHFKKSNISFSLNTRWRAEGRMACRAARLLGRKLIDRDQNQSGPDTLRCETKRDSIGWAPVAGWLVRWSRDTLGIYIRIYIYIPKVIITFFNRRNAGVNPRLHRNYVHINYYDIQSTYDIYAHICIQPRCIYKHSHGHISNSRTQTTMPEAKK